MTEPVNSKAIDAEIVLEPRLGQLDDSAKTYLIGEGGTNIQYFPFTAQSFSDSNMTFKCDPPSTRSVMDRNMIIEVPIKVVLTGDTGDADTPMWGKNRSALRAMPISSVTQTLTANINGQSLTVQLADVCHPISRYLSSADSRTTFSSILPNAYDMYQQYEDGDGAANSPLNGYEYSIPQSHTPRGAYPVKILENTRTRATLEILVTEYLQISPFYWKKESGVGGLANIRNCTFNLTMSRLARMLSISTKINANQTLTINDAIVSIQQVPRMFVGFVTPQDTLSIPQSIVYSYNDINFYSQAFQTVLPVTPVDQRPTQTLTSSVIQFAQLPERLYIYVRRAGTQVYDTALSTVNTTDTYARIENVNINFSGQDGIQSATNIVDLYQQSERNGLNMSYQEFGGEVYKALEKVAASTDPQSERIGTTGSVICFELARDIPLKAFEAVAQSGSWNFQCTVQARNTGKVEFVPELCIITVQDGLLTLSYPSSASTTLGIITPGDVQRAEISDRSAQEVMSLYGGSALSTIKKMVSKMAPRVKKAICDDGGVRAGNLMGGMAMPKRQLMQRAMR